MSLRPANLGQLKESGWESVPVKEEVRRNAIARIRAGEPLFPEVLGYEDTVLPQLENALLAGHDVIFLGERGQAKTRMIRSLTGLLDEWMPIVAGSEINDDPYRPGVAATPATSSPSTATTRRSSGCTATTASARSWPPPTRRSPTSSARSTRSRWPRAATSSDELTLHYGLVPRTNRGIFAINELPDLAERIQVGLLNVLEERDVQIRGYKIRLPARRHAVRLGQPRGLHEPRPHHHPAEGPLRRPDPHPLPARRRDRGGHRRARRRGRSTADRHVGRGARRSWPRSWPRSASWPAQSPHINQRSRRVGAPLGRQPRDARRQRRCAGRCASARPTSCPGSATSKRWPRRPPARSRSSRSRRAATAQIVDHLLKAAVLTVFKDRVRPEDLRDVIDAFDDGARRPRRRGRRRRPTTPTWSAGAGAAQRRSAELTGGDESPAAVASAVEFVLEGLHLSQAAQQGRRRAPGHVPQPGLNHPVADLPRPSGAPTRTLTAVLRPRTARIMALLMAGSALLAGCSGGGGSSTAVRRSRPTTSLTTVPVSTTASTAAPATTAPRPTARPAPAPTTAVPKKVTTTTVPKTTTTARRATTSAPKPAPPTTRSATPPAKPTLIPGQACDLRAGVRDCINPEGRRIGTYLIGGGDCMRTFRSTPSLCTDRDGDGHAGYADSG